MSLLLKPLGPTQQEKSDLIAFLKALTGEPIKFEMPKLPK
jgi:cytochrome c peroxidase